MRLKGRVYPSKKKKRNGSFGLSPWQLIFIGHKVSNGTAFFFHATCNTVVQSKGPPKFSLALAADLAFFFLMGCKIAAEQIQKKWRDRFKKRDRFKVCSTCLRCMDGCIDEGD